MTYHTYLFIGLPQCRDFNTDLSTDWVKNITKQNIRIIFVMTNNIIAANPQNQKLGLLKWKIQNIRPKIGTTYSLYLSAPY